MMKQAADIRDAVHPDEVLFVVDAMIGQDAVNTANAFAEGVGFDGVVLTKLDGDARGGAALDRARHRQPDHVRLQRRGPHRLRRVPSRPDGESDLGHGRHAHPDRASREDLRRRAVGQGGRQAGWSRGRVRVADFLQQMQMVRKMGPLSKVFGMLPGMGELKDRIAGIDERDVDHIEAMIHSMTPAERDNPKIIDGSRRARIAKGAGVEVSEVNGLINRFFEARKMMSSLATGTMPGMPGLAASAAPTAAGPLQKKRWPGVSGNPAKRNAAQQPAAPSIRRRHLVVTSSTRLHSRKRWPTSSCRRSCAVASVK